jgi:1,4-dihydroxy-2-naphthoyl-CoA hydrolase
MYTYSTTIRLHHTDAAGIVFFANLFNLVHECYESFLEPEVTFNSIFNELHLEMPIVHAEADYNKPLCVSDMITIKLHLRDIGNSSFTIEYFIHTDNGECVATVKTSHVVKDKGSNKPTPLPAVLRKKLQSIADPES